MDFNLRVVVNQVKFFFLWYDERKKKLYLGKSLFQEKDQVKKQVNCFKPCEFLFLDRSK